MSLSATFKRLLLRRQELPPELGRNDRCWCGSGRKYKSCHLASDAHRRSAARAAATSGGGSGMF